MSVAESIKRDVDERLETWLGWERGPLQDGHPQDGRGGEGQVRRGMVSLDSVHVPQYAHLWMWVQPWEPVASGLSVVSKAQSKAACRSSSHKTHRDSPLDRTSIFNELSSA